MSFIKLIVYPLAGLVVLWLLPLEFEVAFTVFIALACPAGASVIMFAQRYDRDAYYAFGDICYYNLAVSGDDTIIISSGSELVKLNRLFTLRENSGLEKF